MNFQAADVRFAFATQVVVDQVANALTNKLLPLRRLHIAVCHVC